ncbi:MAG: response regulator [Microcoleus sp. PH2017_29_MFU_D_A]|uniref:adenylate/guanylate cyclase domain-containing protein n=1 Tax=unclassified Microcoleus TaxID=2642155 RepID=UPI001D4962A0|nr:MULTISPECIES: adenylate/guanylate cyclase domain-containing protein [unclassified Microcoleus]MCC3505141.1 response regulator [Microcoleus sp. PH2017_19_SFW_U_A]MCC3509626.1 response regulator [Microcoleus sp. PH2017_17_BER_D_A]TAE10563.1 MAG: response regulator [Oscillatoriales cyanobacterium]MCC3492538.1 response regulator [Microcoleus sp. PH2017_16_JOR_D_A]MCC3524478.1 response regulator [Microcoleus sp. PH2017_20_SFW_D_A]
MKLTHSQAIEFDCSCALNQRESQIVNGNVVKLKFEDRGNNGKNPVTARDSAILSNLKLEKSRHSIDLNLPLNSESKKISSLTEYTVTVLLIDDQEMIGEAVRRMLANEKDIKFYYCNDPAQAIKKALEVKPTVILQDLVMPEIDGLQLLRFFRGNSLTRDIPMIVLSSKEEAELKAQAFSLGANDYLVKLPNPVELIARIRYHSKAYMHLQERNLAYQTMQDYLVKLEIEQKKSQELLLNILPEAIAERLKKEQGVIADEFAAVSVMFADIVGFTQLSASISPKKLVHLLNDIFSKFDDLAEKHGLEKIKTIGDSYMVVAGLPNPRADHGDAIAEMAIDMQEAIVKYREEFGLTISIRIGIHSGPVVAGIIGTKKFIYDLWGDTVNTASRMESHGIPDGIQISDATYLLIEDKYDFEKRGLINVKGKGQMAAYLLKGRLEVDF